MGVRLTDEQRRLRKMTLAQLADEVGALKADASEAEAKVEAIKAEAIRRKITEADGSLFRITLSPPGESRRFDSKQFRADHPGIAAKYTVATTTDWSMRCNALPRAK